MSTPMPCCKSADIPEGTAKEVMVGGRRVALARVEGKLYALDGVCPHRGGDLGRGDLSGFHLYCPEHAWAFDVRDGEAFFPRGVKTSCFLVREVEGEVFVTVPPAGSAAWVPPFGD